MFLRMHDVLNEHQRPMLPIEGYENQRLMILEDAVKPLISFFPGDSLMQNVWVVKGRCKNPADNLTQDESAAIMLYTVEWSCTEQSLYHILNNTLRMENRDKLKPWFPYLRLFIGALSQLPAIIDIVFRGVKKDLRNEYTENNISIWWGFSSCTDNMKVLEGEQFCGQSGVRTMFQIKCRDGRNIKNHSYYQTESEILLMPGRYLTVHSDYRANDGLHMIKLDEIEPPYILLKLPSRLQIGISLLGICSNSKCNSYKNEVIIPIGLKDFDVLLDSNSSTSKCPQCSNYVESSKLGFYKCQWRIKGIKQTESTQAPASFLKYWSCARGNTLEEYKLEENGVILRQLIVETKAENDN